MLEIPMRGKPVQLFEKRRYAIATSRREDQSCRGVQNGLQTVDEVGYKTGRCCVAVNMALHHQRDDQRSIALLTLECS